MKGLIDRIVPHDKMECPKYGGDPDLDSLAECYAAAWGRYPEDICEHFGGVEIIDRRPHYICKGAK